MQLQPGQSLTWTARGELLNVMPVMRDEQAADTESYRYDANSQRVIKTTVQQTGNSRQTQRVVYLPNLELRTTHRGETLKEALQVITVGEAGRAQVRVLHWEAGKPDGINNHPLRYSYDNQIGSSTLELDSAGEIISLEEYYPYGGTAVWSARNQVEADYKTRRYSGKERDATGLYYYGYRYYQPWVGRWLSADPAGTIDGLNLYRMVRNNPIKLLDNKGMNPNSYKIDLKIKDGDIQLSEIKPGEMLYKTTREAFFNPNIKIYSMYGQEDEWSGQYFSPDKSVAEGYGSDYLPFTKSEKGSYYLLRMTPEKPIPILINTNRKYSSSEITGDLKSESIKDFFRKKGLGTLEKQNSLGDLSEIIDAYGIHRSPEELSEKLKSVFSINNKEKKLIPTLNRLGIAFQTPHDEEGNGHDEIILHWNSLNKLKHVKDKHESINIDEITGNSYYERKGKISDEKSNLLKAFCEIEKQRILKNTKKYM